MHEPQKIELEKGMSLVVTWDDGRIDRFSAEQLREACPCASCGTTDTPIIPNRLRGGVVKIEDVSLVGAYAINPTFSPDGHATGIFSYPLLRALGDNGHDS